MLKRGTIKEKIVCRLNKSKKNAFIVSEFLDISDRDQVSRALRILVKEGRLIKIGQGVFSKTRISPLNNKVILADTFPQIAREALEKLNIKIFPSKAERDYNEGISTQIPTGLMIAVKSRIKRVLSYNGRSIKYERIA